MLKKSSGALKAVHKAMGMNSAIPKAMKFMIWYYMKLSTVDLSFG